MSESVVLKIFMGPLGPLVVISRKIKENLIFKKLSNHISSSSHLDVMKLGRNIKHTFKINSMKKFLLKKCQGVQSSLEYTKKSTNPGVISMHLRLISGPEVTRFDCSFFLSMSTVVYFHLFINSLY